MRLAIGRAKRTGRSVAESLQGLGEAEARLLLAHDAGEPDVDVRLDHWLSRLLAAFLSVHRAKGSPPVTAQEIHPGWGWERRSEKYQRDAEAAATGVLLAWAQAGSRRNRVPRG